MKNWEQGPIWSLENWRHPDDVRSAPAAQPHLIAWKGLADLLRSGPIATASTRAKRVLTAEQRVAMARLKASQATGGYKTSDSGRVTLTRSDS